MTHLVPTCRSGTVKPSRTDTFEHTINGLLTKRAEMHREAMALRDRMATIKSDVEALDRTLGTLGFKGDLDALMPRQKVVRLFGQGELLRACLNALRDADEPMTSRDIARAIIELRGDDERDRKYLSDMTRRISKCLRNERAAGTVIARRHSGKALVWNMNSPQPGRWPQSEP